MKTRIAFEDLTHGKQSEFIASTNGECCPICYEPFPPFHVPDTGETGCRSTSGRHGIEDSKICTGECMCHNNNLIDGHQKGNDDYHQQGSLHPCNSSCKLQQTNKHDHQCKILNRYQNKCDRVRIPGCGHAFCRGCLQEHCSYAVSIRNVPIRCPEHGCSSELPLHIIKEALLADGEDSSERNRCDIESGSVSHPALDSRSGSNHNWIKFQRLQKILDDPSLTPCTRCGELVPSDRNTNPSDANPNRLECPICNHVFCRVHGDAHPRMDCSTAATRKLHERNLRKSESFIRRSFKPCSHCGAPIEREAGCDHIICPVCHEDMCFNCGTHIYLTGDDMIRECCKCQKSYIDHRHIRMYRLCIAVLLPFLAPFYLSYVAMTLSMAVLTCGFFCCLGCGVRWKREPNPKNDGEHIATRGWSSSIIFMPVTAVREVLGFVFLPFIDLFRSCGLPCCFCNNAPGLCKGYYQGDDNEDEDDEIKGDDDDDDDEENRMDEVIRSAQFVAIEFDERL
mmetsp:Transcript_3819/g.10843  ORF Transcript_3819/g.10843 Transcript_3819/m.10843 type:complete len:509 (+) Transcript_3819:136-1662(+)